ncbi:MAG: polysaccharide biosynthesis C-terminal domain-containing protein [Erysipelotrichaceae bacterium]
MKNKIKRFLSIGLLKLKTLWGNGAFHVLGGSFLNKFVSMFASIVIVRTLSKSDYGVLSYVENIYNYAFIFAGLGLSNTILRYVVLAKDIEKKKSFYDYALKRGFIVNCIIVSIILFGCQFLNFNESFYNAKELLMILAIALPFQHILDDYLLLERAMFSNSRYAYFSFIILVLVLLFRILGAKVAGIKGVVIFLVIIYLCISIILYRNIHNKYFKNIDSEGLTKEEKRVVNIYAIQFMITNGFWTLFMLNDTFLLGLFSSSPNVLADYKVASVLPGCLGMLSGAIGTYVVPYFIKNEQKLEWVKTNFFKTILVTFILMASSALFCVIFGEYLIRIIYGSKYLSVIPVMNILLLSAIINGTFRYTCANLFAAMGKIKYNIYSAIAGMFFQIVFSSLLIPKYGAIGIAFAGVIVYSLMSIILLFYFNKEYKIFMIKRE